MKVAISSLVVFALFNIAGTTLNAEPSGNQATTVQAKENTNKNKNRNRNKNKKPKKKKASMAPVTVCESYPEGTRFIDPATGPDSVDVLWYRRPATKWVEALAIGNGSFGAMDFGGISKDVLQFNHDTIWKKPKLPKNYDTEPLPDRSKENAEVRDLILAGKYLEADALMKETLLIKDYHWGSYQPFATLLANYDIDLTAGVSGYKRQLDMATGATDTEYKVGDTRYHRRIFVASDQNLIVIRMKADGKDRISGNFTLAREVNNRPPYQPTTIAENAIMLEGGAEPQEEAHGIQFQTQVHAVAPGAEISSENGVLSVKGAEELVLYLVGATSYNKENPFQQLTKNLGDECKNLYEKAKARSVADLDKEAADAHGAYYNRVSLRLGSDAVDNQTPTDELVANAAQEGGAISPLLATQAYQFGRYLLICSSRPGSMATNLQGLWNDRLKPPWNSDYHFNINVQMNYWLAETANLSECHLPLFDLMEGLVPEGKRVAKEMFGARGFLIPHATGGYLTAIPTGGLPFELWTMGAAWTAQHIMEHYRFTQDETFLRERAIPLLKEVALYCLDRLYPDPETGKLISGPDVSPEHMFVVDEENKKKAAMEMGSAMSQQMTWQVFHDYLEALKISGQDGGEVAEEVHVALEKLAPSVVVGSDGTVLEWRKEHKSSDPGHRHLSHLFAFSPGNQYNRYNAPDLTKAALKSLNERVAAGSGTTGWSAAHVNALYARFGIGDKAIGTLNRFLQNNLFPNLLSIYPPDRFQIDGNFGYSLAITEMLLQSHTGEIEILPAIPESWREGKVVGLRARGGYEVSMEWSEGKLQKATIKSLAGKPITVRYGEKTRSIDIAAGQEAELTF